MLRLLFRHRASSLPAVLILALGVGANTALFAVAYGVLLRPLPWPDADRLVRLSETHPGGRTAVPKILLSNVTYEAWAAAPRTIEGIGAWSVANCTVSFAGEPERVRAAALSPSMFGLLRARPLVGRFFDESEGRGGAEPVVVLAASLWRERFSADPAAVGRILDIEGRGNRIVGIAPAEFAFPDPDVRLFFPYVVRPPEAEEGSMSVFAALARLRPGVSVEEAAAEGTAAARSQPRPAAANLFFGEGAAPEIRAWPLAEDLTGAVRPALLVLIAGVFLLLLSACANVANLLLSQSLSRRRELALRTALGATPRRLVRLLLAESLGLAGTGGFLGILLAWAIVRALPKFAPPGFPRLDAVRLDPWMLGFGIALSLATGIVAGLLPALSASRRELVPALRDGEGGATSGRGPRLRRLLLAGEAAFCVVLLVGAGLLARSFGRLLSVDAGYDPASVLVAELVFPEQVALPAGRRAATRDALLERLRATPGVVAAGMGNMVPFDPLTTFGRVDLPWPGADGRPLKARARVYAVTPGYAEALGLRLREGRLFGAKDATAALRPILVNDAFVRQYVRDGKPAVGRQMKGALSDAESVSEIVGIVGDVLKDGLDTEASPEIYVPQTRSDDTLEMQSVAVRTTGDPARTAAVLRGYAREIDPVLALDRVGTLAGRVSTSVAKPRFTMTVLTAFGALALVLAVTGLYGVLSLGVSERRRELSIRSALGADRAEISWLVLRQGLVPTIAGLLVGLVSAAALTRFMARVLFGVQPTDAVAFAVPPILIGLVAVAASLLPARRAADADPADALRAE
jgi:putative ABC transport system permease protein